MRIGVTHQSGYKVLVLTEEGYQGAVDSISFTLFMLSQHKDSDANMPNEGLVKIAERECSKAMDDKPEPPKLDKYINQLWSVVKDMPPEQAYEYLEAEKEKAEERFHAVSAEIMEKL